MSKDMFGNYVIQKALELVEGDHQRAFLTQIKDQSAILKKVR